MTPRRIELLPSFQEAYASLPVRMKERVEAAIAHFVERDAENSLRPELKHGFEGIWSFRINQGYRVFYAKERDEEGTVFRLFHVGHHDDYRSLKRKVGALVRIEVRGSQSKNGRA